MHAYLYTIISNVVGGFFMRTKVLTANQTKMRPQDVPLERVPWKEMKVGGIYERKDGRYFIYCGRARSVHVMDNVQVKFGEELAYTYIYLDYPSVISEVTGINKISLIASSAKLRCSEYRDIARAQIGMIPNFNGQSVWQLEDFLIYTSPNHVNKGSAKAKVKFSKKSLDAFNRLVVKEEAARRRTKTHA